MSVPNSCMPFLLTERPPNGSALLTSFPDVDGHSCRMVMSDDSARVPHQSMQLQIYKIETMPFSSTVQTLEKRQTSPKPSLAAPRNGISPARRRKTSVRTSLSRQPGSKSPKRSFESPERELQLLTLQCRMSA